MQKSSFALKDKVRVRGHNEHAHIVEFYDDIEGGVQLDRQIGGFYSWNILDLVRVEGESTSHRRPVSKNP
jgi:hypothetical protein